MNRISFAMVCLAGSLLAPFAARAQKLPVDIAASKLVHVALNADYPPLELRGRQVYIRDGCWYCHSQFVRPVTGEDARWGPVSQAGEYVYDQPHMLSTRRIGPDLKRIRSMHNWISPILEIRFDMSGRELKISGPDGSLFLTYQEIASENERLVRESGEAERQREQAERQREQAERHRDDLARERETEYQRAERMAAQLRAMGIEPAE